MKIALDGGARPELFADSVEINAEHFISPRCENGYLHKKTSPPLARSLARSDSLSLSLPGELYYRRTFQTLSNVPNVYFDNSIRWLPGF